MKISLIKADFDLPQVSCGLNHTLVLSLDGMVVWAFGDGDYGKLGTGSSTAKYYPQVNKQQQKLQNWEYSKGRLFMLFCFMLLPCRK